LKLAFCLYKYFPYGGLQRDFLRIAECCQANGHDVRVYTLSWDGAIPVGFDLVIVPVNSLTNHSRYKKFSLWVKDALAESPVDIVIGINKMPGLDFYYAADSCYEEKARTQRSWLYRKLPRYRHFAEYERAVFAGDSRTEILMISEVQKPFFLRHYGTPARRMHSLPPGIARDRIAPPNADEIREKFRAEFGIGETDFLVIMVGSGFIKKGLRRALYAVRSLPALLRRRTHFFVVGEDNPAPFKRLIFCIGLRNVRFLAGRDDIPRFLLGADLMIHPALDEAAGIVLLEAMVAGLPVLATDICGYAHYVQEAGVGNLISSPFQQASLNEELKRMLLDDRRDECRGNGRQFAENANIYALHEEASRIIETVTLDRQPQQNKRELAFCLYKYFPFGGLQRDFLRIALECQERGYAIRVYTLSWEGEIPADFQVVMVPVEAITNHTRYERFSEWVGSHLSAHPVDGVIGFNKMPGLDVYYAADSCYEEKARTQRGSLYRSIPRYRHFSRFERAVFQADAKTEILMISEVQKPLFLKHYKTPRERFHTLPPGISRDRVAPPDADRVRAAFRAEYAIGDNDLLTLMIGSGFVTKGLDRALLGHRSLPDDVRRRTRMFVIGQDNPSPFLRMARRLGIADQVTIFGGQDDIPRFLLGADLLIHPAYNENTGTVLLEAVVAGLPVLATDICGYAHYVRDADAGKLVPAPFKQATYNRLLLEMLISDQRSCWGANGRQYAEQADLYSLPQRAAELIGRVVG